MDINNVKDQIKHSWRILLPKFTHPAKTNVNGELSYVCPLCKHGEHGDGLTYDPNSKDGCGLHCFGCGFTGDIIALFQDMNGLTFSDALNDLAVMLNIKANDQQGDIVQLPNFIAPASQDVMIQKPKPGQFKEYISRCAANVEKTDFFLRRGFTAATIHRFQLGYDCEKNVVVIPYDHSGSYYIVRKISEKKFYKPRTESTGKEPLYNSQALYGAEPCFVTESPFDAISIAQSGGTAVAINGTGGQKLYRQIDERKPECVLILCLDFDDAGEMAQSKIESELQKLKISFVSAKFSLDAYTDTVTDPNDLLLADYDLFCKDVRNNICVAKLKNV